MKNIPIAILLLANIYSSAQIRLDGNFPFQTDPAKKYSLYIPSGYSAPTPHRLMLALHPFNTSVWNSVSWCDTLKAFAESNNLILVCPDGGTDGRIDDPIDTAFTSVLLDSMSVWYNIDLQKVYVMGFSWGGMTTYTYGLFHWWRFGGFIPIGAAVNGTSEVSGLIQNASGKPYYLVHGANDNPSVRFTPIRSALIANNAIVEDTLMPGVAHTINFPNRNLILSMAYQWIDSVNCALLSTGIKNIRTEDRISVFPNPADTEVNIKSSSAVNFDIKVFDTLGRSILILQNQNKFDVAEVPNGMYFISISSAENTVSYTGPLMIQH